MKLLGAYLHQRRRMIGCYLIFCAIFGVVFALYHLPPEAVCYPAALCAVIGMAALVLDFLRVRRRHQIFLELQKQTSAMLAAIPDPGTIGEADDRALIDHLRDEIAALQNESSRRYGEMIDYYTLWVHQIKTPIAAMHLTLQNEDSAVSRKLSAELFRIEQYVEMVLTYLRLDAPSTDYVIQSYELDPIIRQTVRKFAGEFINRKIRLDYTPVQETVVTDRKALSFVLEQVLSNALKYTPEGSIRIYMRPAKTLCIADTGIGIAPEDLPRIFEKGYTGCNGRIDQKASGIGLYLCRRICTNLNHPIFVESDEHGTTVCIRLAQYALKCE